MSQSPSNNNRVDFVYDGQRITVLSLELLIWVIGFGLLFALLGMALMNDLPAWLDDVMRELDNQSQTNARQSASPEDSILWWQDWETSDLRQSLQDNGLILGFLVGGAYGLYVVLMVLLDNLLSWFIGQSMGGFADFYTFNAVMARLTLGISLLFTLIGAGMVVLLVNAFDLWVLFAVAGLFFISFVTYYGVRVWYVMRGHGFGLGKGIVVVFLSWLGTQALGQGFSIVLWGSLSILVPLFV